MGRLNIGGRLWNTWRGEGNISDYMESYGESLDTAKSGFLPKEVNKALGLEAYGAQMGGEVMGMAESALGNGKSTSIKDIVGLISEERGYLMDDEREAWDKKHGLAQSGRSTYKQRGHLQGMPVEDLGKSWHSVLREARGSMDPKNTVQTERLQSMYGEMQREFPDVSFADPSKYLQDKDYQYLVDDAYKYEYRKK